MSQMLKSARNDKKVVVITNSSYFLTITFCFLNVFLVLFLLKEVIIKIIIRGRYLMTETNDSIQKFFHDTLIIAKFELVRLFNTKRGLISLLAFTVVWYFISKYPIALSVEIIDKPKFKREVAQMFGLLGYGSLFDWKTPELLVYWLASIYLFPLFSLVLCSDQTSSDRFRGTLRFLTLRTSRDSIFFGRFLGQMLILILLIATTGLSTFFMAIYRDSQLSTNALSELPIMMLNLSILLLPFAAMMALFSSSVRSARLATLFALIAWGAMTGLIHYLIFKIPNLDFLSSWLPGSQRIPLIKSYGWETLTTTTIPLIQTLVLLTIGRYIMKRNAL